MSAAISVDTVTWVLYSRKEDSETVLADLKRIESREETDVAAAGSAAEDSEDDDTQEWASQELSSEKKMVYSIVNEFLGNITFSIPEAEGLLQAALLAEACLPASMQMRLQDVFSPIFYYFPKGVKDRSVWEPRNTSQYIAEWYRLASMRSRFGRATEDSEQLNKNK